MGYNIIGSDNIEYRNLHENRGERTRMTKESDKITFKSLAKRYGLFEEDIELIFACYDRNEMEEMRSRIGYCFFCMNQVMQDEFLFDIICYIKQCQLEVMEDDL